MWKTRGLEIRLFFIVRDTGSNTEITNRQLKAKFWTSASTLWSSPTQKSSFLEWEQEQDTLNSKVVHLLAFLSNLLGF